VVDRYRYWTVEAIVADLDRRRHPFHVAIENWRHDLNIGTVVRTANAFLAEAVHIVGKKRWNRRGAMVTDRYQHVRHHPDVSGLHAWARAAELPVLAVDNLPGARPLESAALPRACVLLFGQEGSGLTTEAREEADGVLFIAQFGSTRSINAGVAAGIAMHAWIRQHAT
jgi:tRNA G18 (ribose-2'-O)-methylase SpoU